MATQILIRRDTATNWGTNNPILQIGELGIDLDIWDFKIGDGATAWNSLSYYIGSSLGDYYTKTELDAGQLDNRYYTETELDALLLLKSNTSHNHTLTGLSEQNHSSLNDDESIKHRLINDSAGNGDTTELWSADKIFDELVLKVATSGNESITGIKTFSVGVKATEKLVIPLDEPTSLENGDIWVA